MKIIRKGGPWEQEFECESCKSLLLVQDHDIEIKWVDDPKLTDETHSYFFTCAVCSKVNYISQDLPDYVKNKSHKQAEQEAAFEAAGE